MAMRYHIPLTGLAKNKLYWQDSISGSINLYKPLKGQLSAFY